MLGKFRMRKIHDFILPSIIHQCCPFCLYADPGFWPVSFSFWRTFNISCKACIQATNPLNVYLSEEIFISQLLKDKFTEYRILGCCFVFFSLNLKYFTLLSCLYGFWEVRYNFCICFSICKVFFPSGFL